MFILIIIIEITIMILTAFGNKETKIPVARKTLLTKAEINFLQTLEKTIPENLRITCKCRMEDIMYAKKGNEYQKTRNRIKSRHVDFVVYDPQTGYTIVAIELDDKSHENRQMQDNIKNIAMKSAGIPFFRQKVQKEYSTEEIKRKIYEACNPPEAQPASRKER